MLPVVGLDNSMLPVVGLGKSMLPVVGGRQEHAPCKILSLLVSSFYVS